MDSMTVINSRGGYGGRICGRKTGYSYLARTASKGDLGLSVVVQSPGYKWSVKITQIKCDQVSNEVANVASIRAATTSTVTAV